MLAHFLLVAMVAPIVMTGTFSVLKSAEQGKTNSKLSRKFQFRCRSTRNRQQSMTDVLISCQLCNRNVIFSMANKGARCWGDWESFKYTEKTVSLHSI